MALIRVAMICRVFSSCSYQNGWYSIYPSEMVQWMLKSASADPFAVELAGVFVDPTTAERIDSQTSHVLASRKYGVPKVTCSLPRKFLKKRWFRGFQASLIKLTLQSFLWDLKVFGLG